MRHKAHGHRSHGGHGGLNALFKTGSLLFWLTILLIGAYY